MAHHLKPLWLTALLSTFALTACDPSNSASQLADLKDTSWTVVSIPQRVTATMSFGADGRVTGSSGCNRFFGTYETSGQKITIRNIGGTRKICPKVEMSVERELLESLAVVNRWQGTAEEIELSGPVNSTTVRLKRAK